MGLILIVSTINSGLIYGEKSYKNFKFHIGIFLEVGLILQINAFAYVEQYLGDIVPKFHEGMAFASHCKGDSSTGNSAVVSTV